MTTEDKSSALNAAKSLRWLSAQFPHVDAPEDDTDRLSNCINLYCKTGAEVIEGLIAQQEKKNKPSGWISVRDRLPEDDNDVLAIVDGRPCENVNLIGAYELASYYPKDGWIIEAYPEWEGAKVTHWAPLPEPPDGGAE